MASDLALGVVSYHRFRSVLGTVNGALGKSRGVKETVLPTGEARASHSMGDYGLPVSSSPPERMLRQFSSTLSIFRTCLSRWWLVKYRGSKVSSLCFVHVRALDV